MHMFNVPTMCRESMEPVVQVDRPINALSMHVYRKAIKKFREITQIELAPMPYVFIISSCLVDMSVFAKV